MMVSALLEPFAFNLSLTVLTPVALQEHPTYFKALHRRAMANESIGSWSSLSASLEGKFTLLLYDRDNAHPLHVRSDFNKLATLPDLTPLLVRQVKQAQTRIPGAIEKQQQKEKDEVMGKLKDLGNTVLGESALLITARGVEY